MTDTRGPLMRTLEENWPAMREILSTLGQSCAEMNAAGEQNLAALRTSRMQTLGDAVIDINNPTTGWTARNLAGALDTFGRADIRNVPTSNIQAEFDRKTAEHARLVDTPLPDGWLQLCMDAGFPGLPADMTVEEAHRRIRAIVNVVLPLHEQMIREQVAKEVRYGGPTRVAPSGREEL